MPCNLLHSRGVPWRQDLLNPLRIVVHVLLLLDCKPHVVLERTLEDLEDWVSIGTDEKRPSEEP